MALEKDISLGEFLRHERERRGISIDQVASATKVGVKTLHALEADHYSELPAKPFIRGFVTSYCRFISLDAKEILSQYDDFINKKSVERPNRDSGHSGYAFEKKDGDQQSRTFLLFAIVGFIAVGGLAMLVLKPSLRHRHSSHIERLRAAHVESLSHSVEAAPSAPPAHQVAINAVAPPVASSSQALVTSEGGPSVAPSVPPAPEANEAIAEKPTHSQDLKKESPELKEISTEFKDPKEQDPKEVVAPQKAGANLADPLDSGLDLKGEEIKQKVSFRVLGDIWVRFQVDDRPVRKFMVRKGKSLILRARKEIKFQVSNPNSIVYSHNGRGFRSTIGDDAVVERQGNSTLFFPTRLGEKIARPFGNSAALEKTPDPEVPSEASKSELPPASVP